MKTLDLQSWAKKSAYFGLSALVAPLQKGLKLAILDTYGYLILFICYWVLSQEDFNFFTSVSKPLISV